MGVGVVTGLDGTRVKVRFWRLQGERVYTTRGDLVIARYEIGHGERVKTADGVETRVKTRLQKPGQLAHYELENGETLEENELIPEVRDVGAKDRLAALSLVHPEVLRARLLGLRLNTVAGRPAHAGMLGARVQWLPHQIDVAGSAVAQEPVRKLLADEVGLGKTVEATMIYAGLRQEGRANRVLILTPEALTIQWLGEIYRKAHELPILLDDERIDDATQDFPGMSPFDAYQRIVMSIDKVADDDGLAKLAMKSTWDLVIVDEAHHLRWKPDGQSNSTYRLVEALAQKTRHLLLLTATPMALDPAEYHALLRLLDPTRFDDPDSFEQIAKRAGRIRDLACKISEAVVEEKAVSKPVEKDVRDLLEDDPEDTETCNTFFKYKPASTARLAASQSVLGAMRDRHALADYVVRNRRGPVGGLPERKPQVFPLTPTKLQSVLIEVGEGVMFDLIKTIKDKKERTSKIGQMLRALWATPRALTDILSPVSKELATELQPYIAKVVNAPLDKGVPTGDSRLAWLVKTIQELPEDKKVLVFVESSVAVRALKDSLDGIVGKDIAVFHRALAPRDQDRQVAWFRDPHGPQVMLSTEAGGEGRNFQFCHHVVLYDLPWRPATIEQRIGRVDRVGQQNNVHVLVPFFKSGYEAAVLKVMQESIGVLDRTVGGIDHALEYVSDQLAELILNQSGVEAWKDLYRHTNKLVQESRQRVESDVDPILDYASFSPERADAILHRVPTNLEMQVETFVQRYASHSKLELKSKGAALWAIEGAPSAAGREDDEMGYVATFNRMYALDHEDVELLSFGHPLVETALTWAREGVDASAAMAIARGFNKDGAIFVWQYGLDIPDDVPEAGTYFNQLFYAFALDEEGRRVAEYDHLLDEGVRPLDRMDIAPLRDNLPRWRKLVEANYVSAEKFANSAIDVSTKEALKRLEDDLARSEKNFARTKRRQLADLKPQSKMYKELAARLDEDEKRLASARERLRHAVHQARPRLLAVAAIRLMRAKHVSA